ncbi:hypothetical protein ACVDG8_029190 [Mesorhizobium sp. ORM8.1]
MTTKLSALDAQGEAIKWIIGYDSRIGFHRPDREVPPISSKRLIDAIDAWLEPLLGSAMPQPPLEHLPSGLAGGLF